MGVARPRSSVRCNQECRGRVLRLLRAVEGNATDLESLVGKGLARMGRWQRSYESVEIARDWAAVIKLQPDDWRWHFLRQFSLATSERHNEVVADLNRTVKLGANGFAVWKALGEASQRLGEASQVLEAFQDALKAYSKALDSHPPDDQIADLWGRSARCHEKLNEWDGAIDCYSRAIARSPSKPEYLVHAERRKPLADVLRKRFWIMTNPSSNRRRAGSGSAESMSVLRFIANARIGHRDEQENDFAAAESASKAIALTRDQSWAERDRRIWGASRDWEDLALECTKAIESGSAKGWAWRSRGSGLCGMRVIGKAPYSISHERSRRNRTIGGRFSGEAGPVPSSATGREPPRTI